MPDLPDRPLAVVASIPAVREAVRAARAAGQTIGFVPTMGALHRGHARLIEQARADGGLVVVSIFVNSTQFNDPNDLARYPRTPEADQALCASAGADLIFCPDDATIYPRGHQATSVMVPEVTEPLEGAHRPGHFAGVATVVLKLLQIVAPDHAYFGEKDYQQLLVVRRMVEDLDVPVRIVGVPTVRDDDGLALSSRNARLSPDQRRAALVLSRALRQAAGAVQAGERSADSVRQILQATVESEVGAALEYAEVADAATLEPLTILDPGRPARALLAVRIGQTRLIDNAPLPLTEPSG